MTAATGVDGERCHHQARTKGLRISVIWVEASAGLRRTKPSPHSLRASFRAAWVKGVLNGLTRPSRHTFQWGDRLPHMAGGEECKAAKLPMGKCFGKIDQAKLTQYPPDEPH